PLAAAAIGCGTAPTRPPPGTVPNFTAPAPLPNPDGWGIHVLTIKRSPLGATWVGTFGEGIFIWEPQAEEWRHIAQSDSGVSWGFLNSIAFMREDTVRYFTVCKRFSVNINGGQT